MRATIDLDAVAALDDAARARLADGVVDLRVADADVLVLTVAVAGATRAAVAAALAGRTPVSIAALYWGHAEVGDGRVRVAMAHRAPVAAALAALRERGLEPGRVIAAGIVMLPGARAAAPIGWLWPLALVPLMTGIGGWALSAAGEARIARLRPAAEARAATDAARAGTLATFARAPVGDLLARLDAALPAGAALHAIGAADDGALAIEIDSADPAPLRAALAQDPVLARARTVAQAAVADRGIRTTLRIDPR